MDIRSHHHKILLYERHSLSKLHFWVWDTKDSMIRPYPGSDLVLLCLLWDMFFRYVRRGMFRKKKGLFETWTEKNALNYIATLSMKSRTGLYSIKGYYWRPWYHSTKSMWNFPCSFNISIFSFYGIFMLESPCFLLATSWWITFKWSQVQ